MNWCHDIYLTIRVLILVPHVLEVGRELGIPKKCTPTSSSPETRYPCWYGPSLFSLLLTRHPVICRSHVGFFTSHIVHFRSICRLVKKRYLGQGRMVSYQSRKVFVTVRFAKICHEPLIVNILVLRQCKLKPSLRFVSEFFYFGKNYRLLYPVRNVYTNIFLE